MKRIIYVMILCACCFMACGKRVTPQKEQAHTEKEYKAMSIYGPKKVTDEEKAAAEKTYRLKIKDVEYVGEYSSTRRTMTGNLYDSYDFNFYDSSGDAVTSSISILVGREEKDNIFATLFYNTELFYWDYEKKFDNEEAAKAVAENIAKEYVEIDEYIMTNYTDDNQYKFEYNRYIDGIKTEETFSIRFSKDGKVAVINMEYLERYKDVSLGTFDIEKAEEIALDKAKELQGNDKEFDLYDKYVATVNGKLGVVYKWDDRNDSSNAEVIFVYLE